MPPNSSEPPPLLLTTSMRRSGPPVPGTSTHLTVPRSEFEDFMNAYRPNLELPIREPPPPKPKEEKVDFGRSIKKIMKRSQGSPSTQSKNQRKEGIQRTPTIASGHPERERGLGRDIKQADKQKPKRPLSANIDSSSLPSPSPFGQVPTIHFPSDVNLVPQSYTPPVQPPPASPVSKTPKTSIQQSVDVGQAKNPKPSMQQPPSTSQVKSPKTSVHQPPPASPHNKSIKVKQGKNGLEDNAKSVAESATALTVTVPNPNPSQVKKKVSIHEEKRRSGTEGFLDAHCLIITTNSIGRFLPPRHNPDPILNMRTVSVPDRKYHIILEFEERPRALRPLKSNSGLLVFAPDETRRDCREQMHFFSWIRDSHAASMGMLLGNVEKITHFPYLTYLVVGGGRQELVQKLKFVGERPAPVQDQLRFLAGYEEPVTICKPPLTTFPEKPASDKTGFVVCLYQVLEGDDGLKFEQNWVTWTGARQIYRTLPEYMGLKRISIHKSIIPTKTINYVLVCEFTNIMNHLTDACVIIDHLRARCCGFIGIYRVLDSL